MPKSHATLVDDIEQELQDSGNSLWTAAELRTQLDDALLELSEYDPLVQIVELELESRTGLATSVTAGALVDATETQFRATDVDKVIFNLDERTWAIVTAFVSTSQLTLSNDIATTSGDRYAMYNQNCQTVLQLYIGDIVDYIGDNRGVLKVEYPIMRSDPEYRNFAVERDVLTVVGDSPIPDSKDSDAIVEVWVQMGRRQQVSQLTDLAGALTANAAALDESIAVDGLTGTEVVPEGQELTITGLRGRYRVVNSGGVTLSAGAGTLTIWPPLESAVENNDVVTFLGSSLNNRQERQVVHLAAGRAAISKMGTFLQSVSTSLTELGNANTEVDQGVTTLDTARALINLVNVGGPNVPGQYAAQVAQELATAQGFQNNSSLYQAAAARAREFVVWGQLQVEQALLDIKRGLAPKESRVYSRVW